MVVAPATVGIGVGVSVPPPIEILVVVGVGCGDGLCFPGATARWSWNNVAAVMGVTIKLPLIVNGDYHIGIGRGAGMVAQSHRLETSA